MVAPPLFDLTIIIILATVFSYFARWLKQPLLVAYVIAGVVLGPVGLGLITDPASIATLGELGIAFLLFTVGLEIDIQKLRSVGPPALLGGIVQVIATFGLGFLLSSVFGFGSVVGLYIGLLFAFSSTMIVAKILADHHEVGTLHGRIMLGILILQDILVVLAIPLLTNMEAIFSLELFGGVLFKGLGLFCIALAINRFISQEMLYFAAKTKEILFFTAVSVCFLFMGLSYVLGFSIAIGAFIGGLALAQFPYNIEIFGEMRSLRDFFAVIFFTTLGMQLNLMVMYHMFLPFIIFLLMIILAKPAILALSYLFMGYGGRTSSTVGLGLGQASEFTFIIAAQGLLLGHLSGDLYSLILSIMVVSMVVTPYFIKHQSAFYRFFTRFGISHSRMTPRRVSELHKAPSKRLEKHTVVFGAGMTGMHIIKELKRRRESIVVLEHDPDVVKDLNRKGIYCFYGEADNEDLLYKLGLFKAKMAIITIPDIGEACFVIRRAKRFNPRIRILARANSEREEEELRQSGADHIVLPKIICAHELARAINIVAAKKPKRCPSR